MPNDRWFTTVAALVLLSLAGAVLLLTQQNQRLKDVISTVSGMQQPQLLRVGNQVPPLTLESLAGESKVLALGADHPAKLLFAFRTDCPACKKTRPQWDRLATELEGRCVNIAAMSSEPLPALEAYAQENSPQYPVYAAQPAALAEYEVSIVPQTLLIGNEGLVLGVWPGELSSEDVDSIQRILDTQRPATQPCDPSPSHAG